jgi:uroporphyrin-III C-methyltransferase
MSKVYLTGAGPGDVELLTIKALNIIKKADVIIYDRLVNKDILNEAKNSVKLVYVGKKESHHTLSQDKINELLVNYALKYDIVVRLKGGDNFIFGRGGEEAIYLALHNISFEIIPGISSVISVPSYAGIPLTNRGISSSFKVVSGHEDINHQGLSKLNWNKFDSNDTIVFLMGYNRLELIIKNLLNVGFSKSTLIALISKGTLKDQKVVIGNFENIVNLSKNLKSPVLIIIGEVIKLRDKIRWFD